MKKLISLLLAAVMLFSFSFTAGAVSDSETEAYDGYPLVVVRGIDFGGFYLEDGSPAISVGLDDIFSLVKNYFRELLIERNEEAFFDSALTLVAEIFEPIAMDRNGNPVHEIYFDKFESSMANYPEEVSLMEDEGETGIIKTAIDKIGAENVYYFTYDWRKSARELADDLNAYIAGVLSESGQDKVNISAVSMGGMVMSAYLYWHGSDAVNNLVYVSSAHNGTYGPGDGLNGDIYFDGSVICSRIKKSVSGRPVISFFVDIAEKIGVFDAVTAVANGIVEDNPQLINNSVVRDGFGTLLGFWAMCPDDVFSSGVEFLFGGHEDDYPVIMEKLSQTEDFILSTEEIIDSAIANGVNVSFISNYNTPLAPYFKHSYLQGDGVLETRLTSNFATVADYGEALTQEQLSLADEAYVSPDRIIDATTALYRDTTWFVRDAVHVAAVYGSDYADFLMWLLLSEEQPTVKTDAAYPQFMAVDADGRLAAQ